jgi:nucleoredoxin
MVFISSDEEEEAFNQYSGEMTFLALPYSERDTKAKLSKASHSIKSLNESLELY